MKAHSSITPAQPLTDLTAAVKYWRQQGERVRRKLDRLGERACLETNVNLQSIKNA